MARNIDRWNNEFRTVQTLESVYSVFDNYFRKPLLEALQISGVPTLLGYCYCCSVISGQNISSKPNNFKTSNKMQRIEQLSWFYDFRFFISGKSNKIKTMQI